jgi:hypothetical protein
MFTVGFEVHRGWQWRRRPLVAARRLRVDVACFVAWVSSHGESRSFGSSLGLNDGLGGEIHHLRPWWSRRPWRSRRPDVKRVAGLAQ